MYRIYDLLEATYTLRDSILEAEKWIADTNIATSKLAARWLQVLRQLSATNYGIYGNIKRHGVACDDAIQAKKRDLEKLSVVLAKIIDDTKETIDKYSEYHGINYGDSLRGMNSRSTAISLCLINVKSAIDVLFKNIVHND